MLNFEYFGMRRSCGEMESRGDLAFRCYWVVRPWDDAAVSQHVEDKPWHDRLSMLLLSIALLALLDLQRHLTRCGPWRQLAFPVPGLPHVYAY